MLQWNAEKDEWLISERGISFEEIALAVQSNAILDDIRHPTKQHQRMLVVWLKDYVWAVPYVKEENGIFLKTAFKSRKLYKRYGHG